MRELIATVKSAMVTMAMIAYLVEPAARVPLADPEIEPSTDLDDLVQTRQVERIS